MLDLEDNTRNGPNESQLAHMLAWYHVSCHEAQSSKQEISTSSEKYRSSKGQGGTSPWKASCFWSKMKEFLRESSWSIEMMHFLLFSPVLLVSTLRFMTAYVTLGLEERRAPHHFLREGYQCFASQADKRRLSKLAEFQDMYQI